MCYDDIMVIVELKPHIMKPLIYYPKGEHPMKSPFVNAKKIFIKNRRNEINFQAGFKCKFTASKVNEYTLIITGATLYNVYLNNKFVFHGPARAPHGYFRFDSIKLDVAEGENVLCVSVAGYNCPSFYTMNNKSFLQAEIFEKDEPLKFTGRDFTALSLDKLRERFVYRYSYQRAFTEVWSFDNSDKLTNWKTVDFESEPINEYIYDEEIIPRGFENPKFSVLYCDNIFERGRFKPRGDFNSYNKRHITEIGYKTVGFQRHQIKNDVMKKIHGKYFADVLTDMNSNRYAVYTFPIITTGFIMTDLIALEDSDVYLVFSEKIVDGQPDSGIYGPDATNIVNYRLKKSEAEYNLQTFEPYSFKYLTILVRSGNIKVNKVGVCEYCYPVSENTVFKCSNDKLSRIFEASKETFRQNTLDCFMDCPGRERAGWLCDSYFTAQAEQIFAGGGIVEELFLKNFIMAKDLPGIPDGLIPCCYPGENASFMCQWMMWYILELEMYLKRKQDDKEYFKPFCYGLLKYFSKYETADGLLRKLDGSNFIEWSDANEFAADCDLGYPTNMLYTGVLEAIGNIYGDNSLLQKASYLKELIVEKAFDGQYFCDGAICNEGIYTNIANRSEACQCYAVFFGVAKEDDKRFNAFYDSFYNFLGLSRKLQGISPEIAFADGFIGFTLRFAGLYRLGKFEQLIEELKEFYYPMAEKTGTLWEHEASSASLNHGFSAYAGVLVVKTLTGIVEINEAKKAITIKKDEFNNYSYDISIGLTYGEIRVTCDTNRRAINISDGYTLIYV